MPLWEGPEKHGVLPAQTEVLYRRMWENETTFLQTSCIFWHQDVDFLTEPGTCDGEARTPGKVGMAEASGSTCGISMRNVTFVRKKEPHHAGWGSRKERDMCVGSGLLGLLLVLGGFLLELLVLELFL